LGRDVLGGNITSTLAGAPALQKIKRQKTNVGADVLGINLLEGGNGGRGKVGGCAGSMAGFAGSMGCGKCEDGDE
jgi:hypothetical protein